MYPIEIVGDSPVAWVMLRALQNSGFNEIVLRRNANSPQPHLPATTLSANISKVLNALNLGQELLEIAHTPNREQVRFAQSAYLLSELPLGQFVNDRYGAPHINITHDELLQLLKVQIAVPSEHQEQQKEKDNLKQPEFQLVIDTLPYASESENPHTPSLQFWYAQLPADAAMAHANITWLGEKAVRLAICNT